MKKTLFSTGVRKFWVITYILILLLPVVLNIIGYLLLEKNLLSRISQESHIATANITKQLDDYFSEVIEASVNLSGDEHIMWLVNNKTTPITNEYRHEALMLRRSINDIDFRKIGCSGIFVCFDKSRYCVYSDYEYNRYGNTGVHELYNTLGGNDTNFSDWYDRVFNNKKTGFVPDVLGNGMYMGFKYNSPETEGYSIVVYFNDEIFHKYVLSNDYNIAVYDKNGSILLSDNIEFTDKKISEIIEDKKYISELKDSQLMSINYGIFINKQNYLRDVNTLRVIMLVGNIACIIIGIMLIRSIVRVNTKPLSEIMLKIDKYHGYDHVEKNEYDVIKSALDKIINQSKVYHNEAESQKKILIETVFRHYVMHNDLESKGVENLRRKLNERFTPDGYAVLSFLIGDAAEMFFETGDSDKNHAYGRLIINNILTEMLGKCFPCYMCDINNTQIAVVNTGGEGEAAMQHISDIVAEAIDFISTQFNFMPVIGISDVQPGFGELHTAYRNAGEALTYALLHEKNVAYYTEVAKQISLYSYQVETEQLLTECILSGNTARARGVLRHIFEVNLKERRLSNSLARCLIFDICGTIVKLVENKKEFMEAVETDVFESVSECSTVEKMQEEITELVEKLTEHISNNKNQGSELADKVIKFVGENYSDERLNVAYTAYNFKLSSDYLSYEFKRSMNIGLLEYINRFRIEKAKNLILETDDTIESISKKVGFSNYRTFFRVFVKYMGVPPKEFRN